MSTYIDGLIPIRKFCARFGIGRTKLYELLASGALEARKIGAKTCITESSAARWRSSLPPAAIAAKTAAKKEQRVA